MEQTERKNKLRVHVAVVWMICVSLGTISISCVPPGLYTKSGVRGEQYDYRTDRNLSERRRRIVDTAMTYIGVPYSRGGSSPRGFDCSGFSSYVYKKNGIRLERTARGQFQRGERIQLRNARAGDLVFFDISGGNISHVGIYIGGGEFVHAPSSGKTVRTDAINEPYWKTRYYGIVRYMR
jgi:peptidoglycan endopeptidase LytE